MKKYTCNKNNFKTLTLLGVMQLIFQNKKRIVIYHYERNSKGWQENDNHQLGESQNTTELA